MSRIARSKMISVKSKDEEDDPRYQCCWKGEVFFDSLKAMISRLLFILHCMLIIWRVSVVLGSAVWVIAAMMSGIVIETMFVMVKRSGKEWNWFQPAILIFLLVEIPCVWLLELEKTSQVQIKYNSSFVILGTLVESNVPPTITLGSISVSHDWWSLVLEQSMLVLIIVARWLMPKGELTREQLSALLLYYLGTASDLVDFFSVLSEDESKLLNLTFLFTILVFWSWSMFQFVFVSTMTAKDTAEETEEELDIRIKRLRGYNIFEGETKQSCFTVFGKIPKLWKKMKKHIKSFVESEAWIIFVSMVMQDGPFAIVRVVCVFHWKITTYTNYFFTLKNIFILILQVYRLVAVYGEYRKAKEIEEAEKQETCHRKARLSIIKSTAFADFGKKERNSSPVLEEDFSPKQDNSDGLSAYIKQHHRVPHSNLAQVTE